MTTESTYTLIQRNEHGDAVNTIVGLDENYANQIADALELGDAYKGERPWTVDVVRELTAAEQAREVAKAWRDTSADRGGSLYKASHIVQILHGIADDLAHLGEMDIPSTILAVKIQVCGGWNAPAGEQIAAVDRIAHALEQTPYRYEPREAGVPGHYGTGHGDLMVVTTAPDPEPAPKPLVSDATIAEAEEISRMVRATDLHLPQAECGCPIKTTRDGESTFVDHCEKCEAKS